MKKKSEVTNTFLVIKKKNPDIVLKTIPLD